MKLTMKEPRWNPADSVKCKRIWEDYQQKHDLTAQYGQTAGIDPKSGRIWFGESLRDVVDQRAAEGLDSPIYLKRVGHQTYHLRGGHL